MPHEQVDLGSKDFTGCCYSLHRVSLLHSHFGKVLKIHFVSPITFLLEALSVCQSLDCNCFLICFLRRTGNWWTFSAMWLVPGFRIDCQSLPHISFPSKRIDNSPTTLICDLMFPRNLRWTLGAWKFLQQYCVDPLRPAFVFWFQSVQIFGKWCFKSPWSVTSALPKSAVYTQPCFIY